ncbi:hypothetical protein [Legionella pneumophila]|uniref:hypothetical protein n=1 Tax=Legionella pneumophila TaxID=446 RepID=UPI0003A12B24|nr:hypothetical protein [Legionella pneumophila]HCC3231832.1 hypothetical protein [Legionella pneumophila subsp. pneumophila]MCK1871809.1 hypothetical protein [Legionella pneumophila]MDI2080350.1 hypothetical protein [Legionella pneumophila]MDI9824100.1 hypothetical protein [Legionella pneumophila]HAT1714201.1 hypothetical protein [Legionella pneumophila]
MTIIPFALPYGRGSVLAIIPFNPPPCGCGSVLAIIPFNNLINHLSRDREEAENWLLY